MQLDPRPALFEGAMHEWLVVSIVMLTQCLNIAGSNQTLPLMNKLSLVFENTTQNDKVWFLAAFPLTAGTFILISGKIGDIYGLKKAFLYGTIWSMIWTLITGLSLYTKSIPFFCICRSFHGIGVSFMLPNAIGIIGNIYPVGQRKALIFCLISASAPMGAFLGCIFAGIIADHDAAPWAFYASSIAFALILCAGWKFLPEIPRHQSSEDGEKVTMDWLGALLGVIGLVLVNFSWNQAPEATWKSPYIITLLIVGIMFLIAFFQYEKRVNNPLLPAEVMNFNTGLVLLVIGLGWASFSIWSFYYWSFILDLRLYSPTIGGATYVPFMIFGITASLVVSVVIRRCQSSYILLGSAGAFLFGITMLSVTPVHQSYFKMSLPQMIVLSFGMDMSFPAASLILSDNLPRKHQGMASSLVSTTTNYAMSIGLGIAGTAEGQIFAKTGDTLRSYRSAMYVGIGFSGLGVVFAILLHLIQNSRRSKNEDDYEEEEEDDDEPSPKVGKHHLKE